MSTMKRSDTMAKLLTYGMLVPFGILVLIPFVWLVLASFKQTEDFSFLFLPKADDGSIAWSRLTLRNYDVLFTELGFWRPLLNSIFLASVTSVLATIACAAGGYALAMHRFPGRKVVTWLVLGALLIPPPLLLAPGYQWLYQLGLLDTYLGLILPAVAPAFGVFLFRQACLQSIPRDMLEAARIDGCGEGGMFFVLALPLVRPMVGAFLMITYLAMWTNYVQPQVVLQDPQKLPLSVVIAQLKGVYFSDYGLVMAGTVVSVAPVMAIFLLLQREFLSGLTLGAVKG